MEKASIAVYYAAVAEALLWGVEHGYSSGPNKVPKPEVKIPAELPKRTRPYARRLFELCEKYGVNWFGEGAGNEIENTRAQFKRIYGLKEDETF